MLAQIPKDESDKNRYNKVLLASEKDFQIVHWSKILFASLAHAYVTFRIIYFVGS